MCMAHGEEGLNERGVIVYLERIFYGSGIYKINFMKQNFHYKNTLLILKNPSYKVQTVDNNVSYSFRSFTLF